MKGICMRKFDYAKTSKKMLTPEIVQLLTSLHEHKGRQDLFVEAHVDEL